MNEIKQKCNLSVSEGKLIGNVQNINDRFLSFSIDIIKLDDYEYELNKGRFKYFSRIEQKYKIVQKYFYDSISYNINEVFSFLGSSIQNEWNISISYISLSNIDLTFSFSNLDDALLFKLVF